MTGAAHAFGLTSLLPLNVPSKKPLMYCNSTEINQTQIQISGNIYSCVENIIAIYCPRRVGFKTVDGCANKILECDKENSKDNLSCENGVLTASTDVVCNSTVVQFIPTLNETRKILQCFPGSYPKNLESFIPTTTEAPVTATTKKELSFGTRIHNFFLGLFGVSDDDEVTLNKDVSSDDSGNDWIPEALTLPPDYELPDQEYPFSLEYQLIRNVKGRTIVVKQHPVEESAEKVWLKLHFEHGVTLPPFVAKVPKKKTFKMTDDLDFENHSDEVYDSLEDDLITTTESNSIKNL